MHKNPVLPFDENIDETFRVFFIDGFDKFRGEVFPLNILS